LILQNFFKRKPQKNSEASQLSEEEATATVATEMVTPERLIGLWVWHEPKTRTNIVNVIFVHGLGGSARETWIHDHSKMFWPSLLHDDDRFANVRISTFGYNSDFSNIFAAKNVLGIPDFAKQLLDGLDLHYDKYSEVSNCC